jgi:hypothetical protein
MGLKRKAGKRGSTAYTPAKIFYKKNYECTPNKKRF